MFVMLTNLSKSSSDAEEDASISTSSLISAAILFNEFDYLSLLISMRESERGQRENARQHSVRSNQLPGTEPQAHFKQPTVEQGDCKSQP